MSGSESAPAGEKIELQPLGLGAHAASADAAALVRTDRTRRGRWTMIAVLLLCALPVVASYLAFYVLQPRGQAYGELIHPAKDIPAGLRLRAAGGTVVPIDALKHQWLLVVVDGGSCVGDCEERLYMQRQLREMLGRERDKLEKLWLVVDDAPIRPALRESLERSPAMRILRADRDALAAWIAPAAGQALTAHLYLIDPLGRWMWRSPVHPEPQRVKKDLDKLLRAAASWDKPGRPQ